MRASRSWAATPIGDGDRRRAFAAAALALLFAAVVLNVVADRPARSAGVTDTSTTVTPHGYEATPPPRVPAPVVSAARRFVDSYLASLRGDHGPDRIRAASVSLRRRLEAAPSRLSPSMRRQRPRIVHVSGHRAGRGWRVDVEVSTGGVRFPISLVVAEHERGAVVTRVVEG